MKTTLLALAIFCAAFTFGQVGTLDFVENLGQFPDQVNFKANLYNGNVYLEDNCFTFVFHNKEDLDHHHDDVVGMEGAHHHEDAEFVRSHAFKTHFVGANTGLLTSQDIQRAGFYNYFIGNNESQWASNVRRFGIVTQHNVYDDIDLKVYSKNVHLKYDFIVHPKADVSQIRLKHEGVDAVNLKDGKLMIRTSIGEIVENQPYAYQVMRNGSIKEVACEYALNNGEVTFVFPNGYDTKKELIIDPVLVAATLSGSTATNYGHSAAFDNDGNIYTGARSFSTGYPTTVGAFQTAFGGGGVDIAVSKLNPDGSNLIYATYIGGNGTEYPHSMITDQNGELWVLGSTNSADFPTSAGAYQGTFGGGSQDHVMVHLSADGSTMIGGTYLGGTSADAANNITFNYGDNFRGEIIVDDIGNCYVASCTQSADFPVTAGAYQGTYGGGTSDGVVFSLNSDMTALNWSTFLGAADNDASFGLRQDNNGDVYVCGVTTGTFIPLTGHMTANQGGEDAYVVKLSSDGSSVLNGTYWGTAGNDNAFFLDLGGTGSVFIYGQADAGIPVTAGIYTDAGSGQYIASFTEDLASVNYSTVIGGSSIVPIAFMVDQCDRIYYSGHSATSSGGPVTPDNIQATGGFYIGVLDQGATGLYFGTYYGGDHVDGGTSRFDPSGIVYQGVCTISGFNTTPGAWSSTQSGWDIGVFKIDFEVPNSTLDIQVDDQIACGTPPYDVPFTSSAGQNATFTWDFGDGNGSTQQNPTHQYQASGTYDVVLIAEDSTGCVGSDTAYATVQIIEPEPFAVDWNFTPPPPCTNTVTLDIDFTGSGADSLVWVLPNQTLTNVTEINESYSTPGTYDVTLMAYDFDCSYADTITQSFTVSEFTNNGTIVMPNVFTPNDDGINELYKPRYLATPQDDAFESLEYYHIVIINRWGETVFESGETPAEWAWDGTVDGSYVSEDAVFFYKAEYRQYCTSNDTELQEKHGFIHIEQVED
ncbi:MAG: PKD domain-containing protein [Fluviicola sp.]